MSAYFDADETRGLCFTRVPVTRARQNCSVIWCAQTRAAAVIDPGGDLDQILMVAEAENVRIAQILITHGHADHCGAAADLAAELRAPIIGPHKGDRYWIDLLAGERRRHGLKARPFEPDRWLADGDCIALGARTLEAIHCPGHTPGHIVYFDREARLAFVGDVLFKNHIGATQLPHGDLATLLRSILGRLWPLGEDVTFIPGHGPTSTFGAERRASPYLSDAVLQPYYTRLMRTPAVSEQEVEK
ncbi:MAG: MBL fold metallo-hydrolase [Hyphomonadaceae bacterium]